VGLTREGLYKALSRGGNPEFWNGEYATSIGLASEAKYISGAPLEPVVPLDTGNEVFIIGAYPSARFGVMNGERDVPMADNLGPFEPERYYDGERVRVSV
jgi:hypothetical protein